MLKTFQIFIHMQVSMKVLEYDSLALNEFLCSCNFIRSRWCLFALQVEPFAESHQTH